MNRFSLKYKWISFIIFCLTFAINAYSQKHDAAIKKARFLIEKHQQQTNIPGIQVAVMYKDSLIWAEEFGYKDLKSKLPVTSKTKFRIASVSKSLTSVALAKLIEKGMLDIDKDIKHYLPYLPEHFKGITARQLAASTAGIRHYTNADPQYNKIHYPDLKSALNRFINDPLLFEPDTQFSYSSYGWVLLSAVMESATEMSFFQIMEQTWRELGMKDTYFDYPNQELNDITSFYIYDKRKGRKLASEDNRSYMYAGGGYLSTAIDLVKMGNKLIKNSYLKEGTKEQLFNSHSLKNGKPIFYGLGWEVGQNRLGKKIVFHNGNLSSARSHLIIFPEDSLSFAYLSNTGDRVFFNDREAHAIAELFLKTETNEKMTGSWRIKTTSLRDKKSTGEIVLNESEDGIIKGYIKFKRSRKVKELPVILAGTNGEVFHFIAVSPMFIDLYLEISEGQLTGYWLHDFNVKGIPETDPYWKSRVVNGELSPSG